MSSGTNVAKTVSDLKMSEVISFCLPTGPGVTAEVWGVFSGDSFTDCRAANLAKHKGQAKGSQDRATHLSIGITGRVSVEVIFICAGWPCFAGGGSFL